MVKFAPESEQSEFNQGIATLMRIHSALLELGAATANSNYTKQYRFLKVLYKEVKPVMNDTERTKAKELKKDTDDAFNELLKAMNTKNKRIERKHINKFDEFEEYLRDMIQIHNCGLPQKRDPRYALANK